MFDLFEVRAHLKAIAEENPDRIAEAYATGVCRYTDPNTGAPSCIIGVLLNRLGFVPALIAELDQLGLFVGVPTQEDHVRHELWRNFTWPALRYMRWIQHSQDELMTWGGAFAVIDKELRAGMIGSFS